MLSSVHLLIVESQSLLSITIHEMCEWCLTMGGPSEREYSEKLNKISEKLTKREKDVRKDFARIEKMKVEALKKSEDMRRSAQHDLDKIEKNITNSKDLAPESKKRLRSEIVVLRNAIRQEYTELKTQISKTLIPA